MQCGCGGGLGGWAYLHGTPGLESPTTMLQDEVHSAERERPKTTRVLVIGAGSSGLATARELLRAGIEVLVLEAADGVGHSWSEYSRKLLSDSAAAAARAHAQGTSTSAPTLPGVSVTGSGLVRTCSRASTGFSWSQLAGLQLAGLQVVGLQVAGLEVAWVAHCSTAGSHCPQILPLGVQVVAGLQVGGGACTHRHPHTCVYCTGSHTPRTGPGSRPACAYTRIVMNLLDTCGHMA